MPQVCVPWGPSRRATVHGKETLGYGSALGGSEVAWKAEKKYRPERWEIPNRDSG